MAYTPFEWHDGEEGETPITAARLNSLENGLSDAADAADEAPSWGDVTGKPSTFPPSTHTHVIGDVTGLQSALDEAPSWGDVTGKPSTFPPAAHTHVIGDVTGLQSALDDLSDRLDALEAIVNEPSPEG